jgi:hypothetical protein
MTINRSLGAATASALISGAAYAGFLAWDTRYYYGSDGHLHGPYKSWQVIGLALVLGGLALVAGILRRATPVVAASAIVITAGFSISAATSAQGDGLWPVGSLLALIGTTCGMAVVAYLGAIAANGRLRAS